jgi:hypothetical protein
LFIGIDPGLNGGLAFLRGQNDFLLISMPLMPDRRVNGKQISFDLRRHSIVSERVIVVIEKSQSIRGQGITSAFNYGLNYGILLCCLQNSGLSFQEISPQKWKREFNLMKKEKEDSVSTAIQLFPACVDQVRRLNKRDSGKSVIVDGLAEALLLAEYGRRHMF